MSEPVSSLIPTPEEVQKLIDQCDAGIQYWRDRRTALRRQLKHSEAIHEVAPQPSQEVPS